MAWWDFFKVFTYAFTEDPLSKKNNRGLTGAGVSQIDAIPDIRAGNEGISGGSGTGSIRLRDTNDFVDLSTVTNRIHRYKEYERLRNMPEIEMAVTVFADEACFSGDTKVMTPNGAITLRELSEKEKDKFLVYCYDFEKEDYTLSWGHSARKTKRSNTIKVILDNGDSFICTPDHRILMADGKWKQAGELQKGSELMPFYRIEANSELTQCKISQFPRIYTKTHGWIHERQFIDEWRTGQIKEELKIVNQYCRMIAEGLNVRQITNLTGNDFSTVRKRMKKHGFSNKEMKWLGAKSKSRIVLSVLEHEEIDVYDITVEKHHNFATEWGIAHNCQKDDNGRVFTINTKNQEIKEELEFLFFHRKMLNFDQKKIWNLAKLLFIYGDSFYEVVINPENPSEGVYNLIPLPADSMYRMETTKGKLIEFQQSKEGPDYQSLARVEVTQATDSDLQQATAIRFAPEQIIHFRIGDDRKTFYPYGVSLIEAARGPAHQLRLMEDAMVVYRLCLIGDTRIRTTKSYKLLKNIEKNDFVYCLTGENEIKPTKVLNFVDNGVQEVFRVRSRNVEIIGTKTHPVLILRDGIVQYVDIQDLKVGKDQFILLNNVDGVNQKIPKIFNSKVYNIPDFVNESFAKLFGFLIRDGIVSEDKKIGFLINSKQETNQFYKLLLESFFGKTKENKTSVISSNFAFCIFENMGYINDDKNLRIPNWLFSSPINIRKSFIEGFLDAEKFKRDSKKGKIFTIIESSNKEFIEDIKELWSSSGFKSGHIKNRKKPQKNLENSSKENCLYSITISTLPLPKNETINEIIPFGEQNVYDITVENSVHNFIANGIPVHNTRAPERRVFYIDVQQMPPYKAEAFMERMKDQFRKKKIPSAGRAPGASSVEERWQAPAADEDFWIPIRPNANTRVETLPGAQNLGEVDDTLYFRNKLFTALNFPRNFFNNEDPSSTRTALSAQDVSFARMIERLQSYIEDGIWEASDRHLRLLGYPEESYEDLVIKMTPPSDLRELTRAELVTSRLNNASNLKGSQLMSDYDIMTKFMRYSEEEAKNMMARLKLQKLEDLKLQIISQNPTLLGVGLPGPNETELGSEPGGPNPMLSPTEEDLNVSTADRDSSIPSGSQTMRKYMDDENEDIKNNKISGSANVLPEPSLDDIKKYNLEIQDYEKEMDEEEIDMSEEM
jgi:intein/homing endonuclease